MKADNRKRSQGHILTREQKISKIQGFTLMSDVFLSIVLDDKEACQYVLRILTGNTSLQLKNVKTQYVISKFVSHDARIDVLAEDINGQLYGMEIHNRDDEDQPRRVRFYDAMIDSEYLRKGGTYAELPELYFIYICRKDLQKNGRASGEIEKRWKGTQCPYEDGVHILYVNTATDDGSATAKLMKYFMTADPTDMSQGILSERVHFLKTNERGRQIVCEVTEEFWQLGYSSGRKSGKRIGLRKGIRKCKKQTARNMAQMNISSDIIAKAINEDIRIVEQWIKIAVQ